MIPAYLTRSRDLREIAFDSSGQASGELPLICGWLRLDKGGASLRATRWLSEARLKVGDIFVAALFIAPTDKPPGDGLNAGCARLLEDKPSPNAPLSLEGHAVRE